jgi:hypothetical protein
MSFYCCDKLQEFTDAEEFTLKEYQEIIDIKYCPFCGYKLSMLT